MLRMAGRLRQVGVAGARRLFATRASVEGEKVYYSQSGCWMTVPGTAGLRLLELGIHESTGGKPIQAGHLAASGVSSLLLPRRLAPGSDEMKAYAAAVSDEGASAAAVAMSGSGEVMSYLDSLTTAGVNEVLVEVSLANEGTFSDGGALQQAVATAEEAADRGLAVRAVLRNAFRGAEDDSDENMLGQELEDAVLALADAGVGDKKGLVCGVISLADCPGEATEEMVRDTVEACFGADCRGESMMERLSLRVGRRDVVDSALALGVTRFEASCLPSPGLLLTTDLIDAVDAANVAHAIDRTALEGCAAELSNYSEG